MLSFRGLSTKAQLAVAAGATLLAVGVAGAPAAYASTASPSAQTVAANSAAVSSCTGRTEAHADHNHVGLTFWYNPDGCVGTVRVTVYEAAANACVTNVQLRIYGNGHRYVKTIRNVPPPLQCGGTLTTYFGIHRIFPNPVEVCARAATTTGGELGPACKTVN
jgi:hypothetical protein